jgi:hypothetical protein
MNEGNEWQKEIRSPTFDDGKVVVALGGTEKKKK